MKPDALKSRGEILRALQEARDRILVLENRLIEVQAEKTAAPPADVSIDEKYRLDEMMKLRALVRDMAADIRLLRGMVTQANDRRKMTATESTLWAATVAEAGLVSLTRARLLNG